MNFSIQVAAFHIPFISPSIPLIHFIKKFYWVIHFVCCVQASDAIITPVPGASKPATPTKAYA
jgi:hypothetical protein